MLVERDRDLTVYYDQQRADSLWATFFEALPGGKRGIKLGPSVKIAALELRGETPVEVFHRSSNLRGSIRKNVTISPLLAVSVSGQRISGSGYIGAWEREAPIPEAMEFSMGRPNYFFREKPVPGTESPHDRVIYMGFPHSSWGHFITEGLARCWYALENPDIPVVWCGKSFKPWHREVLEIIGLANPEIILNQPTFFKEVIFPYPGLSIGDYCIPEYLGILGSFPQSDMIEGKKVFLSRSGVVDGGDEVLSVGGDSRLDAIATAHGFEVIRPQELSVREQLHELSSAEHVLSIEGSALHTPILLSGTPKTRFWALARHRGGAGIYDHIKTSKGLKYETLNMLNGKTRGFREKIDFNVDLFEELMISTKGFTQNLEFAESHRLDPSTPQTSFENQIVNCQVRSSGHRAREIRAHVGALEGDRNAVLTNLATTL
ncbi:glycosyltransferase 61 family protein [Nesterenkonia halotolerans]|uniref:Glycosyltransferase 61 catalytic domain-containing protein n=1 Tax=Nesterenkonia halotolerans TaxID=225325 RepID=A0ABR9J9V7_9MICC|nr:glycosyltransferase family 61 protein [Nesterenkonia halotolerans]MBE1515768.1 hypothetical protein [Nesterenkonia halotolerans]